MQRCAGCVLIFSSSVLMMVTSAYSQPTSEGHPHKWETVDKGMADFLDDGFDLKSVVYESSERAAKPGQPDVHYFLQKGPQLVRCDFRLRNQTSYYWCSQLMKPRQP